MIAYDHASAEIKIDGYVLSGFDSLRFEVDRSEDMFGNGGVIRGRLLATRYEATASVTIDRTAWERLKRALMPKTLRLGRLGGRRAVAIDRVRWPRLKL